MKVMFPQNIKKGFFSGVAFSIAGFSISFIQLVILAVGIVIALGVFSACNKSGAKSAGLVFGVIIFLIFVIIAFFQVSELNLLAFIAKKIKDGFLDTSSKFQINYKKDNPIDISIEKSKQKKGKQRIEIKEQLDIDKLHKINEKGLL